MSIRSLCRNEPVPAQEPSRYIDGRGYVRLRWLVGTEEYVEEYEHRVVMGRPDGEVLNNDKSDNRPENLRVLSKHEHAALHGKVAHSRRQYGPYKSRDAKKKAERGAARRKERAGEVARMAALYESGISTTEVGRRIGIDNSNVSRRLRAAGVKMRPKTGAPPDGTRRGADAPAEAAA